MTAWLVLVVLFPFVVPASDVSLGFIALQYGLFALGLNIIVGWTGLLDLGAAGFVAIGAYTTAILTTQFGWSTVATLPAAALAGLGAGILLGLPTVKHRADYFAILTLGFAELVALGIRNWPKITRGSYGYSGIPASRLPFFAEALHASPPTGFYYLAAAVLVPGFFFCRWLRSTAFGRKCHLIKHSEVVAQTSGIDVVSTKLVAFGLSAAFLAAGGYFSAIYQRSIVWSEFGVLQSCMLLSLVVVGGLGNPAGAVLGAALMGSALEIIRRLLTASGFPQNARFLFFSCLLVATVQLRPAGLLPDRPAWFRRRRDRDARRRQPAARQTADIASEPLLEVHQARKAFGGVVALNALDLRVARGECIALVGTNGAGKSTLINTLSGLHRLDSGTITFDGERIDAMAPFRIARMGVARTFQELSVFDDVDVADNVYVTAGTNGVADVSESLRRFGIADGDRACAHLSYGEKKTLDLARAFVRPDATRLALLDEPTAGLSPREARDVVGALATLRRDYGIAMVIVSHDMKFLDALGVDRVVVLDQGSVFEQGPFAHITASPAVRTLLLGQLRS